MSKIHRAYKADDSLCNFRYQRYHALTPHGFDAHYAGEDRVWVDHEILILWFDFCQRWVLINHTESEERFSMTIL